MRNEKLQCQHNANNFSIQKYHNIVNKGGGGFTATIGMSGKLGGMDGGVGRIIWVF